MTTVNGNPSYIVDLNSSGGGSPPYQLEVQDNGTEIFRVSQQGTVTLHGDLKRTSPINVTRWVSGDTADIAMFRVHNSSTSTTTDRVRLAYNSELAIISAEQTGDYLRLFAGAEANVQVQVVDTDDTDGIICGFRSEDLARVQIGYDSTGDISWMKTPQSTHLLRLQTDQHIELDKDGADGTIAMFRSNGTDRAEISYANNEFVIATDGVSDLFRLETEEHVEHRTLEDDGPITKFQTGSTTRVSVLYNNTELSDEAIIRGRSNLTLQFANTVTGLLRIREGSNRHIIADIDDTGRWRWTNGDSATMTPKAQLDARVASGGGQQTRLILGLDDEERGVLRLDQGTFNTNDEPGTIVLEPQDSTSGTALYVYPWYHSSAGSYGAAGTYLIAADTDPGSTGPSGASVATYLAGPF